MTLRNSLDQKVCDAGVQTRSDRKWSAMAVVDQAAIILKLGDILGNMCTGNEAILVSHFQQLVDSQ